MAAYLKLFYDFVETTSRLSYEEKGRLVEAMIIYARDGVETEAMVGNETFLFPVFKSQIDRDREAYESISEKRRTAGAKGGKAKAANASNCKQDKEEEKEEDKDKEYMSSSSDDSIGATTTTTTPYRKLVKYIGGMIPKVPMSGYTHVRTLLREDMDADTIRLAVDRAIAHGSDTWVYVDRILTEWSYAGVKTVEDANAYIAKREARSAEAKAKASAAPAAGGYQTHEYSDDHFGDSFFFNLQPENTGHD